jgi:hypothetical protein
MNKSELVRAKHKLELELLNWKEIYEGTDGPTAHYLDVIDEIQAELGVVVEQLKAIWRQEKAALAAERMAA